MPNIDHFFDLQQSTLICHGTWTLEHLAIIEQQLSSIPAQQIQIIDGQNLDSLDTASAWLLYSLQSQAQFEQFKPEHLALIQLVKNTPTDLNTSTSKPSFLETLGRQTISQLQQFLAFISFIGEAFIHFLYFLFKPQQFRWNALFSNIYDAGVTALPIVGLMAFLMGVVLAYQGGTQLQIYGANIFIVDLVGITLLRELAPLLTAVIVAGRSGSAYTAQIGTMRLTQELDALQTIGITPMSLLVLPKIIALMIALPLLSTFADVMSILGSIVIAKASLGVTATDFLTRFPEVIGVNHYLVGLGKAPVFAAIIALVGCFRGFQVTGSADSVGQQTTFSVVQAIFLVIVADAIFSVLFNWVGV
ncbi:ABC transporter permease [Candidatus Albibeggiatoa sp. nov. NOAA]|uniref:MlaE family ABC transporter permease n=1 Tax=Candidatus Albibeggiatoa sp. nov. NOAA TaxID=3162724 RepID=UPI003304EC55|nr:ABC transporter permease [Thiotrichaceae bacterium]